MWADFLSHFSEISNVDGAENYTVIKQKPADFDMQQSQGRNNDSDEEVKKEAQDFGAQLAKDAAPSAAAAGDSKPGHTRRNSKLDNDMKFQAELDKV